MTGIEPVALETTGTVRIPCPFLISVAFESWKRVTREANSFVFLMQRRSSGSSNRECHFSDRYTGVLDLSDDSWK